MTGGWLTIRYRPSASSPSLDSACRLSRVRALRASFSPRWAVFSAVLAFFFPCLPLASRAISATVPRTAAISSSSGSWAYQISSVRICANPAMASR